MTTGAGWLERGPTKRFCVGHPNARGLLVTLDTIELLMLSLKFKRGQLVIERRNRPVLLVVACVTLSSTKFCTELVAMLILVTGEATL